MEETLALIDELLEEHRLIGQRTQDAEQVANDASVIASIEKAKEAFVPGRFGQQEGLQQLKELLQATAQGMEAHFNREETALLDAFKKYGNEELVSALHSLLLEHRDVKDRLARSQMEVARLIEGGMSRHLWEASANDMRAHISHTRKLLEAHAAVEHNLLLELRRQLQEKRKEGKS